MAYGEFRAIYVIGPTCLRTSCYLLFITTADAACMDFMSIELQAVMVYVRLCKSLPSNVSVASRSNWGSAYLSGDLHDLYRVIIEEKQRWHVVSQWGSSA